MFGDTTLMTWEIETKETTAKSTTLYAATLVWKYAAYVIILRMHLYNNSKNIGDKIIDSLQQRRNKIFICNDVKYCMQPLWCESMRHTSSSWGCN